eukprot:snap_masked-scaffold_10-processed-gene-6.24-mRNA-1 protein AED:1.00 eAED:1.00 QI:0/0/0/0/1/1/2/0/60
MKKKIETKDAKRQEVVHPIIDRNEPAERAFEELGNCKEEIRKEMDKEGRWIRKTKMADLL